MKPGSTKYEDDENPIPSPTVTLSVTNARKRDVSKENKNKPVFVQFDGMGAEIIADPVALFRIIKALVNDGREPEIRYFDEEIQDTTCWQPMERAA